MRNTRKPVKINPNIDNLTPFDIVQYLDRFIVGQDRAKRAVAVALRNRWRRQQLPPDLVDEVIPKNILIIGPTGVGKTEIARRISKLTRSPFLKVEASKFTEVGYVGRDVESMIRDLAELAVNMVKSEHRRSVRDQAVHLAEERILDLLLPRPTSTNVAKPQTDTSMSTDLKDTESDSYQRTREKLRERLHQGKLDQRTLELEVKEAFGGMIEVFSSSGMEEIGMQIKDMIPGAFNQKKKNRRMAIPEALEFLTAEEEDRLVDMDGVIADAIFRVENHGIVFLDEIDKIAGREGGFGPDVSREGVQRDLLPIIEGSSVTTKYGVVRTNHILFIGSGAFNVSKPADLIPELQGRFPVKVDVQSLNRDQMRRILIEPENALTRQYQALLATENLDIQFSSDAIDAIASLAEGVNELGENIGARRLHTIMELLLDDVSFHASELAGQHIEIDATYVHQHVTVEGVIRAENIRKRHPVGFRNNEKSNRE